MASTYRVILSSFNYPSPTPLVPGAFGDEMHVDVTGIYGREKSSGRMGISQIRIRRLWVPNISWNVVTSNATANLTIGGVVYPIVLRVGYYNKEQLVMEFNTAAIAGLAPLPGAALSLTCDPHSWICTLTCTVGGVATPFMLEASVPGSISPPLFLLLGWRATLLNSVGGVEVSPGPINSDIDRWSVITCDQAKGFNSMVNSLRGAGNAYPWHDGICAVFPNTLPKGTISDYDASDDEENWVKLSRTEDVLIFRLSRERYYTYGPDHIYWSMELELR